MLIMSNRGPLPLDTNVAIEAAQRRDEDFLRLLEQYRFLRIVPRVMHELTVAAENTRKYDNGTCARLVQFNQRVRSRVVVATDEETRAIQAELERIGPLIPKQIANFIVRQFIQDLIRLYDRILADIKRKVLIPTARYVEISNRYNQADEELMAAVEDHYLSLADRLGVDESLIDEKEYMRDVHVAIAGLLTEMSRIAGAKGNTVQDIRDSLWRFEQRITTDTQATADAIKQGVNAVSMDSDLRWLFRLHQARRAA